VEPKVLVRPKVVRQLEMVDPSGDAGVPGPQLVKVGAGDRFVAVMHEEEELAQSYKLLPGEGDSCASIRGRIGRMACGRGELELYRPINACGILFNLAKLDFEVICSALGMLWIAVKVGFAEDLAHRAAGQLFGLQRVEVDAVRERGRALCRRIQVGTSLSCTRLW